MAPKSTIDGDLVTYYRSGSAAGSIVIGHPFVAPSGSRTSRQVMARWPGGKTRLIIDGYTTIEW